MLTVPHVDTARSRASDGAPSNSGFMSDVRRDPADAAGRYGAAAPRMASSVSASAMAPNSRG